MDEKVKLGSLIILFILLVPTISALEECTRTINPNNVPCNIISTWNYTDCNSTQIKIYNSTPSLIQTKNFTDYTSDKCNVTWNITTIGSYVWTTTNGDSGSIIVEVDEKMNIAISIGLTGFAIFLMGTGIWLIMKNRNQEAVINGKD